jgi:glycosyltransferase involved in cell wall biosynthesis
MQPPEISVLIPTKNEPGIASVIQDLKSILENKSYEIIVIDKSDDNTIALAESEDAEIIRQTSIGYGNAYHEGFKKARGKIFVMIDGDDSYRANDVPKMLSYIEDGNYDLAIGNRFTDIKPGAMSILHRFGNYLLKRFCSK